MLHKDSSAKKLFILVALLWMVLSQCGASTPSKKPVQSKKLDKSYFPESMIDDNNENDLDRFTDEWYSEVLSRLDEPILYTITDKNIEIYRLTLIPSFDPAISIRVYQSRKDRSIIVKKLDSVVESSSDIIYHDKHGKVIIFPPKPVSKLKYKAKRQLIKKEWQNILKHVKKSSFWHLKTSVWGGLWDGEQWIMEGVRNGKYHVVDRTSPDDGSYLDFCGYLLTISGVD
ncbi:MAG: hypothetical protein IEMM0008_0627 [bacterium]|nr:MAG: hypothetical protein IEMM0008_0627 [bacterium]